MKNKLNGVVPVPPVLASPGAERSEAERSEVERSVAPGEAKTAPDPEVLAKAQRRQFTADYKKRILVEADSARERTQAFLYLLLHLAGDGDLTHLAITETHRENPNRPVAFSLALLAKPATGLIAAHPAAQPGPWQDRGKVRHLLEELLAGGGKLSGSIFHPHTLKETTLPPALPEKHNKASKQCLEQRAASPKTEEAPARGTRGFQSAKL